MKNKLIPLIIYASAFYLFVPTACKKKDLFENRRPIVKFVNPNTHFLSFITLNFGDTINVIAAPYDLDGTISKVEVYQNDTLKGILTGAPWMMPIVIRERNYGNISLRAIDNRGLESDLTICRYTVPYIDKVNIEIGLTPSNNPVEKKPLEIFAIGSSLFYRIIEIRIFIDNIEVASNNHSFIKYTTDTLSKGDHTYTIEVKDELGNISRNGPNALRIFPDVHANFKTSLVVNGSIDKILTDVETYSEIYKSDDLILQPLTK